MKNQIVLFVLLISFVTTTSAQTDTTKSTFWRPVPRSYEAKQAFEVESLFPMFLTGGYHIGLGYRYERFRVRIQALEQVLILNTAPLFRAILFYYQRILK